MAFMGIAWSVYMLTGAFVSAAAAVAVAPVCLTAYAIQTVFGISGKKTDLWDRK